MKFDKKVYGNLELIVNICVLGKMRIAALISLENLLAALQFFFVISSQFNGSKYDQQPPSSLPSAPKLRSPHPSLILQTLTSIPAKKTKKEFHFVSFHHVPSYPPLSALSRSSTKIWFLEKSFPLFLRTPPLRTSIFLLSFNPPFFSLFLICTYTLGVYICIFSRISSYFTAGCWFNSNTPQSPKHNCTPDF